MTTQGYDVIGDVHGHADALTRLLKEKLGYRRRAGVWRHPERQAVFVGDLIDRGPAQLETIDIVKRMVDAGSARAVMGNHEFNAIAWHTPRPGLGRRFLREHSPKNQKQHRRFLEALPGKAAHKDIIDWFLTLPLWLELPGIRVVHACWHPASMARLAPLLNEKDNTLPVDLLEEACLKPARPDGSVFQAVEHILKGIEIALPKPHKFKDKDGITRRNVRVSWWDRSATTYRKTARAPEETRKSLPDLRIPKGALLLRTPGAPIFFGHYWLKGTPQILGPDAVCLDYSVAKKGNLVAYRWDAGKPLNDGDFVWVPARAGTRPP